GAPSSLRLPSARNCLAWSRDNPVRVFQIFLTHRRLLRLHVAEFGDEQAEDHTAGGRGGHFREVAADQEKALTGDEPQKEPLGAPGSEVPAGGAVNDPK